MQVQRSQRKDRNKGSASDFVGRPGCAWASFAVKDERCGDVSDEATMPFQD